jgi:Zn-dependent peptidase ImmA (M78 family)
MSNSLADVLMQRGMHYSPMTIIESLGISVTRIWLRDTFGAWSPRHRKIVIASGLSAVQERCVLAHELEHALAGDTGCESGPQRIRCERTADVEAARKLVGISDLGEVAQWTDDIRTAAAELSVTERMLQIRIDDLKGEGWPWPDSSRIGG